VVPRPGVAYTPRAETKATEQSAKIAAGKKHQVRASATFRQRRICSTCPRRLILLAPSSLTLNLQGHRPWPNDMRRRNPPHAAGREMESVCNRILDQRAAPRKCNSSGPAIWPGFKRPLPPFQSRLPCRSDSISKIKSHEQQPNLSPRVERTARSC